MILQVQNGNEVVINAPGNSEKNKYIQKMSLNGKNYSKNWLSHEELMKGATIDFEMTDSPNKARGITMKMLHFHCPTNSLILN